MRVGLQTWGTDGDFMPFLALAIGLRSAGHEVMLAYTSVDGKDYSNRSDIGGIELIRANGNVEVSENFNPYAINAKPGSFKEYTTLLNRWFEPFTKAMFEASCKLCQQCDIVIGHPVCHTLVTASQKFQIPRISLVLTPLIVRSDHVSPIGVPLGKWGNSFLWSAGGSVATTSWFKQGKAIRKQEGLPAIKSLQKEVFTSNTLTLVAASEALCLRPRDWPKTVQMTGFLNLPPKNDSWLMSERLSAFLASNERPVYMTFGSCMQFDEEGSTKLLVEAAKLSGKRAIIQSDQVEHDELENPDIYFIGSVPHSEIFPLCELIVHHGGAGTTQAALLAGKPSVVVAHGFDQVYWAKQLKTQKLGGQPLNRNTVAASQIAQEINSVLNDHSVKSNAARVGYDMKAEDGVCKAVGLIEGVLQT